jgi:hypothetical protein
MKGYDFASGPGAVLADLLAATRATSPADLVGTFEPVDEDARLRSMCGDR